MSDAIDYIDDYFTGALSERERREFEVRCSQDKTFASEVAFYISARQSVRDVLLEQKRKQWANDEAADQMVIVNRSSGKAPLVRWASYAAAACIIFMVAGYFLFYQPTPKRLAEKYVNSQVLSQTMDASRDSLQAGIADLQAGNYQKALLMFEGVRNRDAANDEAKKYAGYAYLRLHNYDKALERFHELSAMTGLQSNSGDIMQAVTLLQRDAPGDKETAKGLLEKVVKEDEEGSKEAKDMLDNW